MNWDPHNTRYAFKQYIERTYARRNRLWRFTGNTAAALHQWQTEIRPRYLELLGYPEGPAPIPVIQERVTEERLL